MSKCATGVFNRNSLASTTVFQDGKRAYGGKGQNSRTSVQLRKRKGEGDSSFKNDVLFQKGVGVPKNRLGLTTPLSP